MTTGSIVIESARIGAGHPPFVIAEMSGNHKGSLDRALLLVDAAAASGAHAVKLQTYTADTLTIDVNASDFVVKGNTPWSGRTLHDLYQEAHTPWEWHGPIMQRARQHGLVVFSTPFDETAVDFLEALDVPAYKIASFENVHLPLIARVAATGKPVIISTGMATIGEIHDAVTAARSSGCRDLVLLKCTSTYPATPADSNLLSIPELKTAFQCEVGLSDHTLGIGVSVAAVALGASVIEKHLTLSRAEGGVDAAFSLEPAELAQLVRETRQAFESLGKVFFGPSANEVSSLAYRRSLYVAEDMRSGDVFSTRNLRIIRPGFGLPPKFYNVVLGARAKRDLAKGTAVSWDVVL
ncbi:pseudaminic acid synthase [Hyphomicrobium sp. xq]|uniref:Pseudaminic acid synthase n=1 Tax=Hyphomicrobium album TaxID=2665159 RepID=A0A6I3KLP2_9HYPH|nr:pseudaminic acid synthase [Hyphomicrobium album]MTD94682.1 pseudaminic acid synthase [Hyphomicrobium album]